MERQEILREMIVGIVMQHPEGIFAEDLCKALVARGLAEPDLTPSQIGLAPRDVVRLKP